jgi:uncharacterized protein (DUF2267 family)
MAIGIREDVVYIILRKINETGQGMHELKFESGDFFPGIQITIAELLGHLDFLNQKQFIKADFTGNAYANQEDVPDAANPQEFDFRIASSYGSPDGPLPHLITFKAAELTERGRKMLEKMEANPPKSLKEGVSVPIATKDMPFLEKIMIKAGFEDIFDARDVTEVIFRAMRDLMSTDAADRVADELHKEALPTEDKALNMEIADLWKDTNPIVAFLSRIRPAFDHSSKDPSLTNVNDERFLARVKNEGPMAATGYDLDRDQVVKSVFSATKEELSEERIKEIANSLPGKVRELWEQA